MKNSRELLEKTRELLQNTAEREEMGRRGISVVLANQGAVKRNVKLVEKYLGLSS